MEDNGRIVYEEVNKYIRNLLPERNDYFKRLEAYAEENMVPIIHPEVAKFLQVLIKINGSKSILEVGTAIGYSASIFAEAMKSGNVVSIEINEDSHKLAKENIMEYNEKCCPDVSFELLLGDAGEVLKTVDGKFDIIFIDAAKSHYKKFLGLCYDMLNPGGIIVSDNVLYKGMIADDSICKKRKMTIVRNMRGYLEFISDYEGLETTIIPIGDGVALSIKDGGK